MRVEPLTRLPRRAVTPDDTEVLEPMGSRRTSVTLTTGTAELPGPTCWVDDERLGPTACDGRP